MLLLLLLALAGQIPFLKFLDLIFLCFCVYNFINSELFRNTIIEPKKNLKLEGNQKISCLKCLILT
ncbi:hypothetical protein NTE_00546 [Candidatus Nitrososphaera evergladensis SR1]|uniref:Uncharacterized protein n=1 Tax=Candidatus Nitrososphaera evergladensis SR1 TaxID=1459636 RepID=A0A075MPA8_9ARCH|nr:hypothetical protein NTE_00546 [Candidatus Nitrososphaera evergladensis SR1]